MARDRVTVWFDVQGDYLEVLFDQRPGYFRETSNDQVMEKVDAEGNVLGFSVLKVSAIRTQPLDVAFWGSDSRSKRSPRCHFVSVDASSACARLAGASAAPHG